MTPKYIGKGRYLTSDGTLITNSDKLFQENVGKTLKENYPEIGGHIEDNGNPSGEEVETVGNAVQDSGFMGQMD